MSPSAMPAGVWTKLAYRQPPPSEEFLKTPVNLHTRSTTFRDEREVFIRDVRSELDKYTIEKDGFEFLKDPVDIKNWDDEAEVWDVLRKETPELIKKRLGAKRVFITAERIRRSDASGEASDTTPVYAIHGDSTPWTGMELLQETLLKMNPAPKNLPPKSRVVLVNVWRPLKKITRDPLGFLVPSSIKPEERHIQIFERPADRFKVFGKAIGNYWLDTASYSDQHDWVFLRHQTPDEPAMFLQWDSNVVNGKFESKMSILHSCFEDPDYVDDPDRVSIEFKALAFFDE